MERSASGSPSHLRDSRRLELLESLQLLDTPPEAAFDRLTHLAAQLLGAPAAQINLVDARRQFSKSDYRRNERPRGGRDVPLSHSFCQYVVEERRELVVEDARTDPMLCSNGAVLSGAVVAYVGVPLATSDGYTLGSLCAFDTVPRTWPPEHIMVLRELAACTITEIELRRAAKQLQENYMALQRLELQRGELVDMLVHDLRNPLTSILGGLELISGAPGLTRATQDDVELARTAANALIQMVSEILDVSKAEAGRLGLSLTTTTADAVLNSAVRRVQQLATAQGLTLHVTFESSSAALQVDDGKLCRVLVNLIANAIQHSPAGSQILVAARLEPSRAAVTFRVQDNGPGIPPDVLPRLFEKFQTGNSGGARQASTGLGLSFCKMVVEAHGGTIRVESSEKTGAVFSFTLPLLQSR